MRTEMKKSSPEGVLLRVLHAFALELIDVPDEEILAAAQDLGMDLTMKESAAFAGITYPARFRAADFFDVEVRKRLAMPVEPIAALPGARAPHKKTPAKRRRP